MKKIKIFFVLLLLNACGFEVIKPKIQNYYISNINTNGDKRVNFLIKNNIIRALNDKSKKPLEINLKTEIIKKIKEKNIKNEVTKYQITINSTVQPSKTNTGKFKKISIEIYGDYSVGDQYSQTKNNEKELIKKLTEDIAKEIIVSLTDKLNDL